MKKERTNRLGISGSVSFQRLTSTSIGVLVLGLFALIVVPSSLAQTVAIPPEPSVRPLIGKTYSSDLDGDCIDDALLKRVQTARRALNNIRATQEQIATAREQLAEKVEVELIFSRQITQDQIDAFLSLGGEITYVYQAVSYGWNGRIPLDSVTRISSSMALPPMLIHAAKQAELHMDTATRTGRVRPVWAANFAGNASGFDGNTNITIAIVDTGVDDSHTDLAGRNAYWKDYTTKQPTTPNDTLTHGSHVAGIALGTGAAGGSAAGTLSYTQEGTLSGVPSGSFYPDPIELPSASVTFSATARWLGGGSTTLYLLRHTKGSSGGWGALASVTGTSPLTLSHTLTGSTSYDYSIGLLSNGSMTDFVVATQVSNYPAVGDGFNKFSGVASGCRWAGAKVFDSGGSASSTDINAAIDDLVAKRQTYNIKVMNLSLGVIGTPGLDATQRQKINTAVNNGIVAVVSAGNDGLEATAAERTVDDPGRAAMALTVAASDDNNQLTDYTSQGFTSPDSTEDYKPDLMAPGGSTTYYSNILSVDSNDGDGSSFSDQQANDCQNFQGTSMASPFAAGCAALVIDALQQSGVTWDFVSSRHARTVKMLLCATATESNANREDGGVSRGDGVTVNPTLQRASAGPNGFPVSKDQYEGYGMINPDASVEAVSLNLTEGSSGSDTFGSSVTNRRAWARSVALTAGREFKASLIVPSNGDYDLYLYSANPSTSGTPVLLAASALAGSDLDELLYYTSSSNTTGVVVAKRVSGSGAFTLNWIDTLAPTFSNIAAAPSLAGLGVAVTITFTASETLVSNPTVTVNAHAASYVTHSSTNYTYTYMIQSSDPNGNATLAISGTDQAGNTGSVTNTTALGVSKTYTLTVASAYGGDFPGTVTTDWGTELNQWVTNSPMAEGVSTQHVCVAGTVDGNSYAQSSATNVTLTLTNNAVLTWQWQTRYWLVAQTNGNGTVTAADGWYGAGSNAVLSAEAAPYWRFTAWGGDTNGCVPVGNTITVPMTQARTVVAKFAENLAPLGTPEQWLGLYGLTNGSPGSEELLDHDSDGMFSWQEYVADTDPTNPASLLAIIGVSRSGATVRVNWKGGHWARQYVDVRENLAATNAFWICVATNAALPTPTTNFILQTNMPLPQLFYRIRVER